MPENIYPYCEITLNGSCAALNKDAWRQYISDQEQEAAKEKDYSDAQILADAADKTAAEIEYCNVCPLRVDD